MYWLEVTGMRQGRGGTATAREGISPGLDCEHLGDELWFVERAGGGIA